MTFTDTFHKLEACVQAQIATDAAVRVYKDAVRLANMAANAVTIAEQIVIDAATAAEEQILLKEKSVIDMEQGMEDLIGTIIDAPNRAKGKNPLELCLSTREYFRLIAQKAHRLKGRAESEAELSSIAESALGTAHGELEIKKRVYDNAVANVKTARDAVINISKIL